MDDGDILQPADRDFGGDCPTIAGDGATREFGHCLKVLGRITFCLGVGLKIATFCGDFVCEVMFGLIMLDWDWFKILGIV